MAVLDCGKPCGKNVQPDFRIDIKDISTIDSRGPIAGMEVVDRGRARHLLGDPVKRLGIKVVNNVAPGNSEGFCLLDFVNDRPIFRETDAS